MAGLAHVAGRWAKPTELNMKRLLLFLLLMAAAQFPQAEQWPEVRWEALIPKNWNPAAEFKGVDLSKMKDSDPRAIEALEKLKKLWDNAPGEPSINGRRGRIAGFVLPLEREGERVTEFLVVPYFGACIHVPPPPSNQIIHAKSSWPLSGLAMMRPYWVHGVFSVERGETYWGVAGYRLTVEKVLPYEDTKRKSSLAR